MKKWMFFVAASLSVFAACSNEDDLTVQPQPRTVALFLNFRP